jgi:hypothetical protein
MAHWNSESSSSDRTQFCPASKMCYLNTPISISPLCPPLFHRLFFNGTCPPTYMIVPWTTCKFSLSTATYTRAKPRESTYRYYFLRNISSFVPRETHNTVNSSSHTVCRAKRGTVPTSSRPMAYVNTTRYQYHRPLPVQELYRQAAVTCFDAATCEHQTVWSIVSLCGQRVMIVDD